MNYKNEKLGIYIYNAEYFEIKEFADIVILITNKKVMYTIFAGSCVKACSASSVEIYDNSHVKSSCDARIVAFDNSKVEAYGSSRVVAYNNSVVEARDNSRVDACDNSRIIASGKSRVDAHDNSSVIASDFSTIYALNSNPITRNNHYGTVIQQVFKVKKRMTVYKKLSGGLIAELELKKGQIFQSANHSKCRTSSAKVLRILGDNGEELQEGVSQYDDKFVYRVGEIVASEYDPEIKECSKGIHFFLDRKSAENY